MKKISFAAAFGMTVTAAMFSSSVRAEDVRVLRTVKGEIAPALRMIQADNRQGDVTVTAVTEDFGWEWTFRGPDDSPRTARYADACQVEVREVDGALRLTLIRPDSGDDGMDRSPLLRRFLAVVTLGTVSNREREVRADLRLRVPAGTLIEVKNRFGAVRMSGLRAAAKLDCQNGRVDLSNIDAPITAKTSFATLRAEKIGPAWLTNQNGRMEVRDVAGPLQATTSFAELKIEGVKGDALLENRNGAIEAVHVSGDLDAGSSFSHLRIEDVGGNATVKGQNARIDVKGVSGIVIATTSFGGLRVEGAGAGAIVKNQNGRIDVTRVTGDVIAETSFADLHVEEIAGRADLSCRNGRIEAARVNGDVRAANSFSPLHVRAIGGAVELKSENGDVTAADVTGDVRAETSFGRLRLEGNGPRFEARNRNGAVEIVAHSPAVQHIEVRASFAPIDVRLPAGSQPLIRAATSFGQVRSDFPVLSGNTLSDARFAADATPLKISLKGENADIRIQRNAVR